MANEVEITVTSRDRTKIGATGRKVKESLKDAAEGQEALGRETKRTTAAMNRQQKAAALMRGELVSLIAGAAAVAPAFAAAGAAAGAFGAVAAPSIIDVVKAQTEMGKHWDSLNAQQAESARMLAGLIDRYQALNRQFEPQALEVFNRALATGNNLMEQATPLARAGGEALSTMMARANSAVQNEEWTEFFRFLATQAPEAMDSVGDALGAFAALARDTIEAVGPLSGVTLDALGGVARLAGGVIEANPALAQMAVLALALRAPMRGLSGLAGRAQDALAGMATGADRARGALRLLGSTALLAGLVLVIDQLAKAKQEAEEFADTVVSRGRDIDSQIRALNRELERQKQLYAEGRSAFEQSIAGRAAANKEHADTTRALTERIAQLKAERRADAQAARLQADVQGTLSAALQVASDKTKTMEERLKALQVALDAVFNKSIGVWNATTQLKAGYDTLIEAVKKANGNFKGNTEASRTLRDAFAQQLQTVADLREATLKKTGSEKAARQAAARHIPVLRALAGNNKGAQRQVTALARSLGVASRQTDVTRREFLAAARAMGIGRNRAERLWREFRKIPKNVRTGFRTPGMSAARQRARNYRNTLAGIPRTIVTQLIQRISVIRPGYHGGLTTGGVVGGQGRRPVSHAQGGGPRSNRVLVGEHGPEIADLPFGTRVIPNPRTRSIMAGQRGGGGGGVTVNVFVQGSIRSDRDLIALIRDEFANGGFRGVIPA